MRYLFICALAFNIFIVNAQTFYSEQKENLIFYSPDIAPTAVCVGDIEGDGDEDILSFFDKKFRLYTHLDGKGTFQEEEIITALDDWILSVCISDLNNDGKQDILAASYNNDKIIWYENNGDGTFGSRNVITDSVEGASSVFTADLDNDGDQDVLSASLWDNKIAWYENMGGGFFGEQQLITELAEGARYVYVSDLNGDGRQDVISASIYDHKIAWYENRGDGIFGEQQIVTNNVSRALCVYADDLNGDGFQDILSASEWDNKIAWYENDGLGNFGAQQLISDNLKSAQSVYAADLDNDGDQDVLSASLLDNKIAWYENMGTGDFGMQKVVTNSADMPGFVYATDIDGDGYKDILSASTDFKIAWYENTLPLNIISNPKDTAIFPDSNAGFEIVAGFATGYQWQSSDGDGFFNLTNSAVYTGVNTNTLEITAGTFALHKNKYRCVAINGTDSLYSRTALLSIIDTVNPVITSVPIDTILQTGANCIAELPDYTGNVVASDNSYGEVHITQTPVPFSKVFGAGEELTLTATDEAGNSTHASFHVDVVDLIPPVINTFSDTYELEYNGNGQFILPDFTAEVEVSDNCSEDSAINITQEPAPNTLISDTIYSISVTLTATDEAGNDVQIFIEAITLDNIPPLITSTHNGVTVDGGSHCQAYMPDFRGDVQATDNIDMFSELVIIQIPAPNTLISGNDNKVTLTVKDKAGNAAAVSFNVEVSSRKPSLDCIQDQYVILEQGQTSYTVSGYEFDPASLEIYCGFASLTNNINNSSSLDQTILSSDTTIVVWTLTDEVGNIGQCSFKVILNNWVGTEIFQAYGISVHPNPTSGDIFIGSDKPVQGIRILDLNGRIMMDRRDLPTKGSVNMAPFKSGTYILNIIRDEGAYNMKIVKD